jgi:hypothetical protein
MSKLYNDIKRMLRMLKIIEQYNNFQQLDATEDILFLKEKINNLYNIKDSTDLIDEFKWCAEMTNNFYNEIDIEFKKQILKEESEESE